MMGPRQIDQALLFYEFSLERHIPATHLLRAIDRFVDLSVVRSHLAPFYSSIGRPSIDPELLVRMLLVGYCYGIRSERRLCEEVHRRGSLDNGEPRCIAFGGLRVDDAIEEALLRVVEPGAIAAAVEAEAQAASRRDQVREALVRDLEAARYSADRAFRQYDAVDPQNRLIAAELELRWNSALTRVGEIETRIAAHDASTSEPSRSPVHVAALAADLKAVWSAPPTDARLKKRIVRTVIHEVVADIDDEASEIVLLTHWMGGVHTEPRLQRRAPRGCPRR